MRIVKVEIFHDGEYWCAASLGEAIFTQGKSLDELVANLREAVELHFEGEETPTIIGIIELRPDERVEKETSSTERG